MVAWDDPTREMNRGLLPTQHLGPFADMKHCIVPLAADHEETKPVWTVGVKAAMADGHVW